MKQKIINVLFWSMLIVYAVLVLDLFFRPIDLFNPQRDPFGGFQLVPFHSIVEYLKMGGGPATFNLAGNVVVFIPFGIYLYLLQTDKRVGKNLLLIAATSLAVELLQALLRVGVTDIDDVLLNTLGGFIGILFCLLLHRVCKNEVREKTIVTILSAIVGIPVAFLSLVTFFYNL